MDYTPKTRQEKKGNKEKRNKELGKYTSKHVRIAQEKQSKSKSVKKTK
jgi:hypothetical protein